jgi:hypothetical protein
MCTVSLSQLAKTGGGYRGLAIVEDVMKVAISVWVRRLTDIQKGVASGGLWSRRNVAYSKGRSTDEVLLSLDLAACKARRDGLVYFLLEYDLYKYCDQIDRRLLMGIMVLLGFPGLLVAGFGRRYLLQRLVSDTICGPTAGFARGPYGIDQGSADGPVLSQLYQSSFLEMLASNMETMFPLAFLPCAFADNHWVGFAVPGPVVPCTLPHRHGR